MIDTKEQWRLVLYIIGGDFFCKVFKNTLGFKRVLHIRLYRSENIVFLNR